MKYIVNNGFQSGVYEAEMAYIAVQMFLKEFGDSMDQVMVRTFGGTDKTATSIWPRARKLTTIS